MNIKTPTGEARNRAVKRACRTASIAQCAPSNHHAGRLSFPPVRFLPRPATSDNICFGLPKRAIIRPGGGLCHPVVAVLFRRFSSHFTVCTIDRDPRPAAATFAGKGSDHARDESEAPLRTLAGVDVFLRIPGGRVLRRRPGRPGVPALRRQAHGGPDQGRSDEGISPDPLLQTAAPGHRAPLHAGAAASPGYVRPSVCWRVLCRSPFTWTSPNPSRPRQRPTLAKARRPCASPPAGPAGRHLVPPGARPCPNPAGGHF